MVRVVSLLTSSLLLSAGVVLLAQDPAPSKADQTRARAEANAPDVSHGTIKELTAGQKIVINVDNAPDKTFDLTDKDVKVKMAKGLKVGDMVTVAEHSVMGKTKSVNITKHTGAAKTATDPAKKP
jgi:hypothetical protein